MQQLRAVSGAVSCHSCRLTSCVVLAQTGKVVAIKKIDVGSSKEVGVAMQSWQHRPHRPSHVAHRSQQPLAAVRCLANAQCQAG